MKKNRIEKVHVLCSYCKKKLLDSCIKGDNENLYCSSMCEIEYSRNISRFDCKEEPTIKGNHNTDGSKTSYYDIDVSDVDTIDINWLADKLNLSFFQGNVLKSLYGIANPIDRHSGTSSLRDAKKMVFYSQLILDKETKRNG